MTKKQAYQEIMNINDMVIKSFKNEDPNVDDFRDEQFEKAAQIAQTQGWNLVDQGYQVGFRNDDDEDIDAPKLD